MKQYYKLIDGNIVFFTGNVLVLESETIISPTEELLLENGWMLWEPPTPEDPTEEELLEEAKDLKIEDINEYDSSSNVNLFYLAGQPMWLDAQTRLTLRISIESYAAMGCETATKWFGGQQFTFPINAWLTMLNALEVYAAEALNTTEAHKANVRSLTSIQEVEDYDFTTDYPEKLNLSGEWLRLLGLEL